MVRTQIRLTENQLDILKRLSTTSGRSIADLIRQTVELCLRKQVPADFHERSKRALAVAGKFSSRAHDVSTHHDHYLTEAFRPSSQRYAKTELGGLRELSDHAPTGCALGILLR